MHDAWQDIVLKLRVDGNTVSWHLLLKRVLALIARIVLAVCEMGMLFNVTESDKL